MPQTVGKFAHSSRLRIMAFVAWLLLAVAPVYGLSAEFAGAMKQAGHTTSSHRSGHQCDPAAAALDDQSNCGSCDDDCCSDDDCGTCSSQMGLPVIRELVNTSVAGVCWSQQDVTVPSSDFTPPLRPPAD